MYVLQDQARTRGVGQLLAGGHCRKSSSGFEGRGCGDLDDIRRYGRVSRADGRVFCVLIPHLERARSRYGRDIGTSLPELLTRVLAVLTPHTRLRLGMTNPP